MTSDLQRSLVRVLDANGSIVGTGFVISSDGLVATCAHVIQASQVVQEGDEYTKIVSLAFLATGAPCTAKVLPDYWRSPASEDIALLRIDGGLPDGIIPVLCAESREIAGHPFRTFGFPDPNPEGGIWGTGEILGQTTFHGMDAMQIRSQEVTAGFSGAPVLDILTDCIIGMVSSIVVIDPYGRQSETAFAIPVEIIHNLCPDKIPLLPGNISSEKLSSYLEPLAAEISRALRRSIPVASVQGGVPLDYSEVVYMPPPNDENEIPIVRVFEPLKPLNNLLFQKFKFDGMVATFTTWLLFLFLYTGGIWLSRSFMHTPLPKTLLDFFRIAEGTTFYYPDWNSFAFDTILNPILATLACVLPVLVAKRLTLLFHSGLFAIKPGSGSKPLVIAPWQIFSLALLVSIATVIGAWFSRYQYYQTDPFSFRLYVLFLIGLSTYVRWSLLILALQTIGWVFRCEFRPTYEFLSLGKTGTIHPLGELGILLFITFYCLIEYALITFVTSVAKNVPLVTDSLFWEAAIQMALSIIGLGMVYIGIVYRPHLIMNQAKEYFIKSQIMKIKDIQERQIWIKEIQAVPTLFIWESARRQAVLLIPFFLYTLLPFIFWIVGNAG